MLVKVVLVDINPKMIKAWQASFEENPEVDIVAGSMLDQTVGAWVSPTNARGSMDGGLDAVIKSQLGQGIENQLQKTIKQTYGGKLPIGHAVCTATGKNQPRYLISTPTMVASSEDVSDTMNVALACAAAFQAVNRQNSHEPGSIRSVALPGLGANTGQVPVEICADLMWTGYNLFREHSFDSFQELRAALQEQLGDLTPMSGKVPKVKSTAKPAAAANTNTSTNTNTNTTPSPAAKPSNDDFDDFDDFE